ncbi:hypothetical protein XH88_02765 [Bradyrhizobium sp. CCBAU 51627]|nr:hypothetical protein [Bradyrhizobium sp. CCBAU 51627]
MPVEIALGGGFLGALRCHSGRVRPTRNTARPELLALQIVFGKRRLNPIRFRPPRRVNIVSSAHCDLLS